MLAPDGTVRTHWRGFVEGFAGWGRRARSGGRKHRRLLRESGIAFNVYADPDDRAHAWRLDLVPVVLPEGEWDRLAAGILQRARLIDAVLSDLYGPQRLLPTAACPRPSFWAALLSCAPASIVRLPEAVPPCLCL